MLEIIEFKKISEQEIRKIFPRNLYFNHPALSEVRKIIREVKLHGDKAVIKFSKVFDEVKISTKQIRVKESEIEEATKLLKKEFIEALKVARKNIYDFHLNQIRKSFEIIKKGIKLSEVIKPISRVGLYIPGGEASYPSTVLMLGIPAKMAGVKEIALSIPPQKDGKINPYTLTALAELGFKEVYRIGGVQAIAALAYGTESVKKVDKIFGPGNIYVTLAKKEVFGDVGIDLLAGPTEIVVVADETAKPSFIAADLLSQAEHGQAISILITSSSEIARKVNLELERQLKEMGKAIELKKNLRKGKIFLVKKIDDAAFLINIIAPEHLEIMVKKSESFVKKIKNAGAIFVGEYTPVSFGDYLAGSSHVLPTSGAARFSSPLNIDDFVKKTNVIRCTKKSLMEAKKYIELFSEVESLTTHALPLKARE